MAIRWEKVQVSGVGGGPGVRWGHTCNAIRGGKLLYVFGGYGKDQCQTNQIHVFDAGNFSRFISFFLVYSLMIHNILLFWSARKLNICIMCLVYLYMIFVGL